MLSFATGQSASHAFIEKVQKATQMIQVSHPGIPIEGPIQFDAAISIDIASVKAIGPILQGLKKPANDLSRGCSAEGVYNMIAIIVLQAQSQETGL